MACDCKSGRDCGCHEFGVARRPLAATQTPNGWHKSLISPQIEKTSRPTLLGLPGAVAAKAGAMSHGKLRDHVDLGALSRPSPQVLIQSRTANPPEMPISKYGELGRRHDVGAADPLPYLDVKDIRMIGGASEHPVFLEPRATSALLPARGAKDIAELLRIVQLEHALRQANPGFEFTIEMIDSDDDNEGAWHLSGPRRRYGGTTSSRPCRVSTKDCKYSGNVTYPPLKEIQANLQFIESLPDRQFDFALNPGGKIGLGVAKRKYDACVVIEFIVTCMMACICVDCNGRKWTVTATTSWRTPPQAHCGSFWVGIGITLPILNIINTTMTAVELWGFMGKIGLAQKMAKGLGDVAKDVGEAYCEKVFKGMKNPDGSDYDPCKDLPG